MLWVTLWDVLVLDKWLLFYLNLKELKENMELLVCALVLEWGQQLSSKNNDNITKNN